MALPPCEVTTRTVGRQAPSGKRQAGEKAVRVLSAISEIQEKYF
jgi:hypothetical protein